MNAQSRPIGRVYNAGPLTFVDVDPAEEERLFAELCATKRKAEASQTHADMQIHVAAYRAYMRLHLTDPEQQIIRLEDELARLTIENRALKMRLNTNA